MKKITNYLVMCLFIIGFSQFSHAQIYGKWVVPIAFDGGSSTAYQLIFSDTPIVCEQVIPPQPTGNGASPFSAGGYNTNYDLNFYIVGDLLFFGNSNSNWTQTDYGFMPECQIIQKPNSTNEYYVFYSVFVHHEDQDLCYNTITFDEASGIATSSERIVLRGYDNGFGSFAITEELNNQSYIYAVLTEQDGSVPPDHGLYRWTISEFGVTDETSIVTANDSFLEEKDFDAYNLEYKKESDGNDVIAWTHGIFDPYQGWDELDEIVVVTDGDPQIFDLNLGRIGGIEFSICEDNIIYVSCTNVGIVKLNYLTGVVNNLYTPATPDYSRTFLQTAPDGHIYGVSNDGRQLGRILQSGTNAGTFEAEDVLSFPYFNSVSTYKIFTDPPTYTELKYYVLPENDRVYVPLQETVIVEPESCPDMYDGEVWITVTGGAPFQSPNEPYLITCQPEVTFTWDEENHWFHGTGLTEGIYEYTITDAYNNVINGEFLIVVDYSDYTFIEHHTYESSVIIINEVISFAKGFTVLKDVNVTFNNCTLLMGVDAKIIIEHGQVEEGTTPGKNGAVLTFNNTTVTNHARCNLRWQGIEVSGFYNQSQLPGANGLLYQGRLVVINESVIENAWNAVTTSENGVFGTHGGIIRAENSTFRNNKRSVEILSYQNFNPYIGVDARMPYSGMFKKCTFEYTDEYIQPMDMNTHVSIWNVWYINFYGCRFLNNTTHEMNRAYGIYSLDAGYRLVNYCNSTLQPCPVAETVKCEFKNLFTGIHASNAQTNNSVYVNDADFENNSIGVYLSNMKYPAVLTSRFHIGDNPQTKSHCADNSYGFGIDAHACTGFAFEDNIFDKAQAATTGYYTGIRVSDCPSDADVIYRNNFDGLSYGNYAYGTNRQIVNDDRYGVIYQCNQNTNNTVDFIVTQETDPYLAMIHTHQGIPNVLASGNTFSDITGDNDWNFRNEGKQNINWYYTANEVPVKYFHSGTPELPLFTPIIAPSNTCPSHYGGGVIKLSAAQKLQKEAEFAINLSDYNNVKALYDNLKDGGNTTSELLDIQTATPDEMWTLRSQLLGHSPHLSEEVLKEVADRTDIFPESAILDILAANPDELDMDMISYLENKEEPLPDYMISILYQVAGGTTYKTVLLHDMAYYHVEKTKAGQDIIRSILSDSVVNYTDYRNWLDNIGGMQADKQIIESYLSKKNTQDALLLLNILPGLYELEGDQLNAFYEYSDLINLQINLMNENRTIFELTPQEQSDLLAIAGSNDAQNRATAKNILKFSYGYQEYECQYISDPGTMKSITYSIPSKGKAYGMAISVVPNPAASWAQFNYTLPYDANRGILVISDITGKTLETMEVQGNQGSKLWDTRDLPKGVYLYTLTSAGFSETGKIVISR